MPTIKALAAEMRRTQDAYQALRTIGALAIHRDAKRKFQAEAKRLRRALGFATKICVVDTKGVTTEDRAEHVMVIGEDAIVGDLRFRAGDSLCGAGARWGALAVVQSKIPASCLRCLGACEAIVTSARRSA